MEGCQFYIKDRDHLLQDLVSLKETKSGIGQANYYPNLVIVPDTSHIQIAPNLNGSSLCKINKRHYSAGI
jgi:hypothetical protein